MQPKCKCTNQNQNLLLGFLTTTELTMFSCKMSGGKTLYCSVENKRNFIPSGVIKAASRPRGTPRLLS